MQVTAVDSEGNEFTKEVEFLLRWSDFRGSWVKVVSFGFPYEYYWEEFSTHPRRCALSIDLAGKNHLEFPVTISPEQMSKIIDKASDSNTSWEVE